jgi:hypothetical protein
MKTFLTLIIFSFFTITISWSKNEEPVKNTVERESEIYKNKITSEIEFLEKIQVSLEKEKLNVIALKEKLFFEETVVLNTGSKNDTYTWDTSAQNVIPAHFVANDTNKDENHWVDYFSSKKNSIYYKKVIGNPCSYYLLKIVNHTGQKLSVQFGVAGELNKRCRNLYKNFNSFQYREIYLDSNETVIGSESVSELLIPNTSDNVPFEDLIQNFTIQNTKK